MVKYEVFCIKTLHWYLLNISPLKIYTVGLFPAMPPELILFEAIPLSMCPSPPKYMVTSCCRKRKVSCVVPILHVHLSLHYESMFFHYSNTCSSDALTQLAFVTQYFPQCLSPPLRWWGYSTNHGAAFTT